MMLLSMDDEDNLFSAFHTRISNFPLIFRASLSILRYLIPFIIISQDLTITYGFYHHNFKYYPNFIVGGQRHRVDCDLPKMILVVCSLELNPGHLRVS